MPTFHIRTFGCKTNQYEGQGIREALAEAGYVETASVREADVCVVNTCTVTQRADAEARKIVRAIHRDNPGARIVITGCMADLEREEIAALDGVVLVLKNAEKHEIARRLKDAEVSAPPVAEDRFGFSIHAFAEHTRAFVKIQDGCANYCSYCTVPYARGTPQSRPMGAILAEARDLVENGYPELVLTGINIGQYSGSDGATLATVIRRLGEIDGLARLRLGSVEPPYVTDDLLAAVQDVEPACPHLHIPLQSGDDTVLRAMNRQYGAAAFAETVARTRAVLENPAITTDIIVGFPGEGDDEFNHTLRMVERMGFSRTHVFLFSPRPGTPAAEMKQTSPNREITARRDRLLAAADRAAVAYAAGFVGQTVRVLFEQEEDGAVSGYTDRYLRLRAPGTALPPGQCVDVRVTAAEGDGLRGDILLPDA